MTMWIIWRRTLCVKHGGQKKWSCELLIERGEPIEVKLGCGEHLYLLKVIFVLIVVVFLSDDFDAIVLVVSVFVVRVIFGRAQHVSVLIDSRCLFIGLIVVGVRSEAAIVRVVQVDVGVWNVDVFAFISWYVSANKNNFLNLILISQISQTIAWNIFCFVLFISTIMMNDWCN